MSALGDATKIVMGIAIEQAAEALSAVNVLSEGMQVQGFVKNWDPLLQRLKQFVELTDAILSVSSSP